MWIEIFLVAVIILLLGWILFSGSGVYRQRKLLADARRLADEVHRLREANEALRAALAAEQRETQTGSVAETP